MQTPQMEGAGGSVCPAAVRVRADDGHSCQCSHLRFSFVQHTSCGFASLEVNNLMIAISFGMTLGVTISLAGLLPMSGSCHPCISRFLMDLESFRVGRLLKAKRGHHAATPEVISKELRGIA